MLRPSPSHGTVRLPNDDDADYDDDCIGSYRSNNTGELKAGARLFDRQTDSPRSTSLMAPLTTILAGGYS